MHTESFSFDYQPGAIHYGRGQAEQLEAILTDAGYERALVVCGSNTGANEALMEPIERGLGETHRGTFDGTTPDKRAATAVAVAQRADDLDADVLVPVGGGSSLDVATVASVVRADGRDTAAVRAEVRETGGIALPDDESALTPLVPVPTTLAGADLSTLAGITVELDDTVVATGVGGTALMPAAVVYDPALFETTPRSVLAGSAMNGFDKAIESLYAANRTPVTDATARRAVAYFDDGLPRLFDEMDD
ncbi:MAG: iron-containing alcohol dehydrogenase, partial [Halobaculum sp.]